MLVERQQAVHERVAQNLIQRVVAAHVLAQDEQIACEIEQSAGMQAAGFGKCLLRGPQLVGQAGDQGWGDLPSTLHGWKLLKHALDARLAAQAAA